MDSARNRLRKLLGGKPAQPLPAPPAAQRQPPVEPPKRPVEPALSPPPPRAAANTPTAAPTEPPRRRASSRLTAAADAADSQASPPPPRRAPASRLGALADTAASARASASDVDAGPPPVRKQQFQSSSQDSSSGFSDANLYLQGLRSKMAQVAEEFAQGKLNRVQFQEIYSHYQRQRSDIETALFATPGSNAWRGAVSPGQTTMLRQRHTAQILSYAIYDNTSSMPLAAAGEFKMDASLLVPMLSSFRSATQEMFGGGMRSTEIEGGRWLSFVPGRYTTLFALFSVEPSRLQLTLIQDLHRDFETAHSYELAQGEGAEAAEQFIKMWTAKPA